MDDYEVVVGIETHVQILTRSKMFCGCDADFAGAEPNTHTCPVCLGLPGALPVPNGAAVTAAVRTGLALGGAIHPRTWFERKNYHYPDLAKGYQISQFEAPLCTEGGLEITLPGGGRKRIGLERLHLEEDTAKIITGDGETLLDFNRSGVPLMEIVTRPDMRSGDEARAYLDALRQLLRWLGVSTGNMEDGALRADVNISVRPHGATHLGAKIEIKNLNSFAAAKAAIEHESTRLADMARRGESVRQSTRGWDERKRATYAQRTKETSGDYRYFMEPDLPPLVLAHAMIDAQRAALPELPDVRREHLVTRWGLAADDARVLTRDRATADFALAALDAGEELRAKRDPSTTSAPAATAATFGDDGLARAISGWIAGPLFALTNAEPSLGDAWTTKVPPAALAELAAMVDAGALTRANGKDVLAAMWATGNSPGDVAAQLGLGAVRGDDEIASIIESVIDANPKPLADYLAGKDSASAFFVGQVMRAARGQADAKAVRPAVEAALARRRP